MTPSYVLIPRLPPPQKSSQELTLKIGRGVPPTPRFSKRKQEIHVDHLLTGATNMCYKREVAGGEAEARVFVELQDACRYLLQRSNRSCGATAAAVSAAGLADYQLLDDALKAYACLAGLNSTTAPPHRRCARNRHNLAHWRFYARRTNRGYS